MGQELQAVGAIRSMLSARASIEGALARDVGWLFRSNRLESITKSLTAAAEDARAGARAVTTDVPDAAARLEEAAGVLEGVRELGSRDAWHAARPEVGRARDLVEDAIVQVRTSLAPQRAAEIEEMRQVIDAWTYSKQLDADQWTRLAELSELPVGLRPASLEHVGPKDVTLLREQAKRMAEGLPSSRDPRLHDVMEAARQTRDEPTREALETQLTTIAQEASSYVGVAGERAKLADRLGSVAALQRLDPMTRPRMLARTTGIEWTEAAALVRDGATVPPSWDGFRALRGITYLQHPQPALEELLHQHPETFTATQWRMRADLVRLAPDERPAALAGFSKKAAREMEMAANMVGDGVALPSSWKGFTRVNQLRANVLWTSQGAATEHLGTLTKVDVGRLTKEQLSDLDALRLLPEGRRPSVLDPNETAFQELALSPLPITHPENGSRLERVAGLHLKLKSPDELRGTLDRVDSHIDELERIQTHFSQEAPRPVLNDFAADLRLLRAFELDDTVKRLIGETSELVEHNVNRLDGKVGGGYGRHVDYADLGRIKENVRLFTELAREQALGESNTVARARQAAQAATREAEAATGDAAAAGDELLTW
jgi:hypothetical protein